MKDRLKNEGTQGRKEPGDSRREGRFLNLKGESSSYALLRCLMELEELPAGGVLEVLVSEARVSVDLSKLLTEEGHAVVEVERTRPGVWKLDIQKGER